MFSDSSIMPHVLKTPVTEKLAQQPDIILSYYILIFFSYFNEG